MAENSSSLNIFSLVSLYLDVEKNHIRFMRNGVGCIFVKMHSHQAWAEILFRIRNTVSVFGNLSLYQQMESMINYKPGLYCLITLNTHNCKSEFF